MDRGRRLLDAIYDDVDQHMNPDGVECWHCGGEGETYDCIDGSCRNAQDGCEMCAEPCIECTIYERSRAKAVREAVIETGDLDVAVAWIKEIGRWRDDITTEQVQAELNAACAALAKAEGGA